MSRGIGTLIGWQAEIHPPTELMVDAEKLKIAREEARKKAERENWAKYKDQFTIDAKVDRDDYERLQEVAARGRGRIEEMKEQGITNYTSDKKVLGILDELYYKKNLYERNLTKIQTQEAYMIKENLKPTQAYRDWTTNLEAFKTDPKNYNEYGEFIGSLYEQPFSEQAFLQNILKDKKIFTEGKPEFVRDAEGNIIKEAGKFQVRIPSFVSEATAESKMDIAMTDEYKDYLRTLFPDLSDEMLKKEAAKRLKDFAGTTYETKFLAEQVGISITMPEITPSIDFEKEREAPRPSFSHIQDSLVDETLYYAQDLTGLKEYAAVRGQKDAHYTDLPAGSYNKYTGEQVMGSMYIRPQKRGIKLHSNIHIILSDGKVVNPGDEVDEKYESELKGQCYYEPIIDIATYTTEDDYWTGLVTKENTVRVNLKDIEKSLTDYAPTLKDNYRKYVEAADSMNKIKGYKKKDVGELKYYKGRGYKTKKGKYTFIRYYKDEKIPVFSQDRRHWFADEDLTSEIILPKGKIPENFEKLNKEDLKLIMNYYKDKIPDWAIRKKTIKEAKTTTEKLKAFRDYITKGYIEYEIKETKEPNESFEKSQYEKYKEKYGIKSEE